MKIENAKILINIDRQIKEAKKEIELMNEIKSTLDNDNFWRFGSEIIGRLVNTVFKFIFKHRNEYENYFISYITKETQVKIIDMIISDIQKRIEELKIKIIEYGGELE